MSRVGALMASLPSPTARNAARGPVCGGTKLWREHLHAQAERAFNRRSPAEWQWWQQWLAEERASFFAAGLPYAEAVTAGLAARRRYMTAVLSWYRNHFPISERASRANGFAMEAERVRIFGGDE